MRTLLLVYGEYRNAEIATKSWNILNNSEVDVYIHTQNVSIDRVESDDIIIEKNISEESLRQIFPTSHIFLENRNEYEYSNPGNDMDMNIRSYRFLYDKTKDIIQNYDLVMISRLDSTFYIHDIESFFKSYDENVIYVNELPIEKENGDVFMQDHTFFGSTKVIDRFLKNLPNNIDESHQEIPKHIKDLNIECRVWSGFSSFHLRYNMKPYFEEYFDINGSCKNTDISYLNFNSNFFKSGLHLELERRIKI